MTATRKPIGWLVLSALVLVPSFVSAQEIALRVTGAVKTPLKLSLAEVKEMPRTKLTAKDHDGSEAMYEGVALHEILRRAGVPQGESLRGEALSMCLLVKGADGYRVVFALAELDLLFN